MADTQEKSKISFTRLPARYAVKVLHCSCSDGEGYIAGAFTVTKFTNGEIELSCNNCDESFPLADVMEAANK